MERYIPFFLAAVLALSNVCHAADKRQTKQRYKADSAYGNRYRYEPNGINHIPTGPVAGGRSNFIRPGKEAGSRLPKPITDGISPFAPPPANAGGFGAYSHFGPGLGGMGAGFNPRYGAAPFGRTPARRPQSEDDSEALKDALDEIAKAWKTGNGKTLQARFAEDRKVGVFLHGKLDGEVPGFELGRQIAEGVPAMKTTLFKFEKPKGKPNEQQFVTGTHTYTDADQNQQTAYVSYTLERVKGRWMIVEYGWSDKPVSSHARPSQPDPVLEPDPAREATDPNGEP